MFRKQTKYPLMDVVTDMTPDEARDRLAELGYKIRDRDGWSFDYANTANGEPYQARSIYIVEADTGISFAHYKDARRDSRFDALQNLRYCANVVDPKTGRVWEL